MALERLEVYLLAVDNPDGRKQRRIFKRKRGGVVLTREQVKAIKCGRKVLRKEMKKQGMKSREDFELTAASMGLYMDRPRFILWWLWFFHGHKALASALLALTLLMGMFGLSVLDQIKELFQTFIYQTIQGGDGDGEGKEGADNGYFTINMSQDLLKEGFVLSDSIGFENPSTSLSAEPAEDIPCISILQIPDNVDQIDGEHNDIYFAYTFYIRNEGETIVDYEWTVDMVDESKNLSDATWIMVFEDGEMLFYAEDNADGEKEALPAQDDNSRGYSKQPLVQFCKSPDTQYELISQTGNQNWYRVVPVSFESLGVVARGGQVEVEPMDVHKYTVVIWLEGDDPDCTNDMIGGHISLNFNFRLIEREEDATDATEPPGDDENEGFFSGWTEFWDTIWEGLKFWQEDE